MIAILLGIIYLVFGQAAKTDERRQASKQGVTFKQWLYIATRHGAVVLSAAYVMTFGLEVAMNGWLGTYYREGFGQGDIVIAATFAATFSIAAGLLRPLGATSVTWSRARRWKSCRGSTAATANSGRSRRWRSSRLRWSG